MTANDQLAAHKDDAHARKRALEPDGSFIVQAPAGSGKTGLLVYRILRLLAVSQQPESVLAITFTRKATREMRERLVDLLRRAEQNDPAKDEFDQQGLDLAAAALAQDKLQGWALLDTPQRIQIQTIDALSLRLVAAMPWLSRLGAQPSASDDAQSLYQGAIEQFLVDELLGDEVDPQIQWLLTELDFNYMRMGKLFSSMLSKRDQWLRHLLSGSLVELRPELEQAWQTLALTHTQQLAEAAGSGLIDKLIPLVEYAHANLVEADKLPADLVDAGLPEYSQDRAQSDEQEGNAVFWRVVSIILLTNSNGLRKRLDKSMGFPPEGKAEKEQLNAILAELDGDDFFLEQIAEYKLIPLRTFSDYDWEQLQSLEHVLKKLAAYLQLQFRYRGKSDHSEVTQRANLALQELDDPTDLSLKLDYQINHILVDEFQDTSFSQIALLKRLMLGWSSEVDQGSKTVFLVGDPMQSIYRFREADVGLFLDVWNNDTTRVFEHQTIEPLSLSRNFRSSGSMVDWFNTTFVQSFPKLDNSLTGAVRYAHATTHRDDKDPSCVEYLLAGDKQEEATLAVATARAALAKDDKESVAILVRSRTHLKDILPLLDSAGVRYQGLDLAPLSVEPAVIDVLHLTRALSRLDDRIAWLALLRGPWVGISLSDIQTLCADSKQSVIAQLQEANLNSISAHAGERVHNFRVLMRTALGQAQQVDLDVLVKWTWQQLGGMHTQFGLSDASMELVFERISEHQSGGELISLKKLEKALESLYAVPDIAQAAPPRLTITTIHKSKGLEFDTVILPGLGQQSKSDDKDLLMWAEWQAKGSGSSVESQLLLAPLAYGEESPHYQYLRNLESNRGANERSRLLYVAATRAAKSLILTANLKADQETGEPKQPPKTSLLHELWAAHSERFEFNSAPLLVTENEADAEVPKFNTLTRLPHGFSRATGIDIDWRSNIPSMTRNLTKDPEQPSEEDDELEFAWAGEVAIIVGNLIHQWFEYLDLGELHCLPEEPDYHHPLLASWRSALQAAGLDDQQKSYALRRLLKAVRQVQQDANAEFIFADRSSTKTELGVAAYIDGALRRFSIDRTFEDDGVVWIVDHKTTDTRERNLEQFADTQVQERHKKQLEAYGRLMRQIDARPIQLAVYFPLLKQLRSWSFSD